MMQQNKLLSKLDFSMVFQEIIDQIKPNSHFLL